MAVIDAVITGTGLYTPADTISNEELVAAFNLWVADYNDSHAAAIAAGTVTAKEPSSAAFIEKASGIKSRHVVNREGILNPKRMAPDIPERDNDALSVMAEMAVAAAEQALSDAGLQGSDIDAVIVAASNMQRAYPAVAIEVQHAIGAEGYAFDMNVACSSATFGIQQARDTIRAGSARRVLMVNPEICTGHLNFRDRDSHFIFGDVATAVVLERSSPGDPKQGFAVRDTRLQTLFSNAIRNNFGFLNRADPTGIGRDDKLFIQEGRRVFKEVCPAVAKQISEQLAELDIATSGIKRLWLHQANRNMNDLIARKVLGRDPSSEEAPIILDQYANTSSAGSVIAFHQHKNDFLLGDVGILCSFGAGYSIGSVVLERV